MALSALALAPDCPATADEVAPWRLEVAPSLAAAEADWRAIELEAPPSPYQRFDWVAAFATGSQEVRAVLVRDAGGRVVAVLPLSVTRSVGLRIGRSVGGKHANLFVPPMRPGFAATLTPARARALLEAVGRELRLDALALCDLPLLRDDVPNPLAASGRPAASPVFALRLDPDGEATLRRSTSQEGRKKLRNKERNLAKLGRLEFQAASCKEEVEALLDAFLRQKRERFRQLGIADPFADPATRRAVMLGCLVGLEEGRPAIELYGLLLDGRPIAIFGAAATRERLSGMFISFEQGAFARYSPGDVLLTKVVARQCQLGRMVFDLGVGEARYKRSLCDTVERLVDVALPLTVAGRLHVGVSGLALATKRRLKASPRAVAAIASARRGLARLRRGPAGPA